MTAVEVAAALGARPAGPGRWRCACPAHGGDGLSLSLREGPNGEVWLHCFSAGCPPAVIRAALRAGGMVLGVPTAAADRERLRHERSARVAAELAQRQHADAVADAAEAAMVHAGRLAGRLAAVEFGGAPPAYPGEADDLTAAYHAALGAAGVAEAA